MSPRAQNTGSKMRKQSGQTLIIAILILGVLLIIGFAFAGLVSSNIREAGRAQTRTIASDLAQAGLSFAHSQLSSSTLGADWRPEATPPTTDAGGLSRDPDALYLRPATGLSVAPDPANPGLTFVDRGGPDFKGPYSRVFTDRGRRLIRVRYSPNDLEGFTSGRDGALRQPGKARSHIIIESIGRSGALLAQGRIDPTRLLTRAVRVGGFADGASLVAAVGEAKGLDQSLAPDTRRMVGFASLGLIESARFITNKSRSSRPAEVGFPVGESSGDPLAEGAGVGAAYPTSSGQVAVEAPLVMGQTFAEPNLGRASGFGNIPGGGGLFSNADLLVHGSVRASLNAFLGESWSVSGKIRAANSNSRILLTRTSFDTANDRWTSGMSGFNADGTPYTIASTVTSPFVLDPARLESDQPSFSTGQGSIRDGSTGTDTEGYVRGTPRKDPPSMLAVDSQTKRNRYYEMTRSTGRLINGRRMGTMGYGEGVYVDSFERGNLDSEDERRQQGAVRSLPSDWLNPGNSSSLGWQGPYYIPIASYIQLLPDGFEIIRDSRSRTPYWRNPNGGTTNSSRCRFRLRNIGGRTFILNSIQSPALASAPASSISDGDFTTQGEEFNGVLFVEGDVRIRGIVPTDVQMTVVSMGSIYIEGSITKGTVLGDTVLNRPSRSMLMLMARDYTTINTTMFFGPLAGQTVAVKASQALADTPSPIELDPSDAASVILNTEFLSGPEVTGGSPSSPSTWRSYATSYEDASSGLAPHLILSASADDNGPTFVALDSAPISFGDPASAIFSTLPIARELNFGTAGTLEFNAASQWLPSASPTVELYGLGDPAVNAYPKFEAVGFPLLSGTATETARRVSAGTQTLALNDPTLVRVRLAPIGSAATKNFLMARAAVVPHDIKIEASLFAEEGSFFVIPGSWFNTNPDDTRSRHLQAVTAFGADQARLRRFQTFGSSPITPFYGEPLDIRIRIIGSIAENMPAPMSQQAQWLQKWGWIPAELGGTGRSIPRTHFGSSDPSAVYVPNLTLTYDPALALGTVDGVNPIRTHPDGWILPPMPRLPVSPTLAYFGDANP
jgi:hypothetical protein